MQALMAIIKAGVASSVASAVTKGAAVADLGRSVAEKNWSGAGSALGNLAQANGASPMIGKLTKGMAPPTPAKKTPAAGAETDPVALIQRILGGNPNG